MGQPDLSPNSLISHPDVFADIINFIIYEGKQVLGKDNLKPYFASSSAAEENKKRLYSVKCMEDTRNGIRYVIWEIKDQFVFNYTTPFKVMGSDFTGYYKQITEFAEQNKKDNNRIYVNTLQPEQKIKPVITIVLYYGTEYIPDNICSMIDMPEDEAARKYVQNYSLNMIRLRELTKEQADMFRSDFACIAKFLSKSYNKEEQMEMLKNDKQVLIHTKDILYTLAAITRDDRYLQIIETGKEETAVCEIADAFVKIGIEQGIKSMIEACKELGVNKANTLSKVAEKFNLEDKKAVFYMDKYWI